MPVPAAHDRWAELRALTPARVGLGRSGAGLPTQAALRFALDHARAKDAVHAAFDVATIVSRIGEIGHEAIAVTSRAGGRGEYLQRPDLGRQLDNTSRQLLCAREDGRDRVVIVAGDGLSPAGVNAHAVSLIERLLPRLSTAGVAVGPIIVATGSRVALGDDIGESLGAHLVVMLIGERPGLSAPDSLGVYLTYAPRIGCKDADRNCVSNIHSHGLTCEAASAKTAWLVREALLRQMTGVRLKDESELDGLLGTQTTGKVASIAVAETEKSSSFPGI